MRVDFAASRLHFWAHLEPVHDEMVARGVESRVVRPQVWTPGPMDTSGFLAQDGALTVVAASGDMYDAHRAGRPVVLMEHGAGQSYSNRDPSYVGGRGREKARLVLVPNEQAAERHRKFYSDPPCAVVGCPRLDRLLAIEPPRTDPPTVVVTWHWDAHRISLEARSAWPFIGPAVLDVLCEMRDEGEIRLIGSAHPRIINEIEPAYVRRGIPIVDGDELFRRADVLVADNTSTMYEFAALDRPVVVLDAPVYRTQRRHGLRFWDCANIGPRVTARGGKLSYRTAVTYALDPDEQQVETRREIIERVFPFRGEATRRAADAICEVAAQMGAD